MANLGSNSVSVIKTSTNTVVKTISVGDDPDGVAISSTAGVAYVTNNGSGTVDVIKTSTNTVIKTIRVGSGPSGVAINPAAATPM